MYQFPEPITLNNASRALVDATRALASGEQSFSLVNLQGSDSSGLAVVLDLQRQAARIERVLHWLDIPNDLIRLARLYGIDTVLTGLSINPA